MKLVGNHVMVDLETLGTGSNAAIVSLGAAAFNEKNVYSSFYRKVDVQSCVFAGMTLDVSTIEWWLKQSDEARAVFGKKGNHIVQVLLELGEWFPKDACVWGNGATFDNVILSNAYKATQLDQPWKFWNDRCYRTVKNLYPEITAEPFAGVQHNALDDAMHQAKHLIKIAGAQ